MANRAGFDYFDSEDQDVIRNGIDGKKSWKECAQELASHATRDFRGPEGGLERVWGLIIVSVREFPDNHAGLVELLTQIAQLPPAKDEEGKQLVMHGGKVWEDLPMFGWEINSEWNGFPGADDEAGARLWYLVNHFTALLVQTKVKALDYKLQGLWTMRSTLEYPLEGVRVEDLEWKIAAAAIWIDKCGKILYEGDEEWGTGDARAKPAKGGELWDGKHGLCKERWDLWKKQFGRVAELDGVSDETKKTAKQAADNMAKIES